MSLAKTHREFLEKHNFLEQFDLRGLDQKAFRLVNEYGFWLEALEAGMIIPETDSQRHFVSVCTNSESAQSEYEKAWLTYRKIIDLDRNLKTEIVEPILSGKPEVISQLSNRDLPDFAFDNLELRLRREEDLAVTSVKRLAIQDAILKMRRIGRKGSPNRYSHTNFGGLHDYGL